MIYDYLTGQPLEDSIPFQANEVGWYAFDFSPFDTITNWFLYDGANYFYYEEDKGAIDFSANPVFNGELFPPIEELVNTSQIQNSGTFGTGNFAADQGIGLTNGILDGGEPSVALTNRDIVNNGGLQALEL
jgi:hypothetical protein